MKKMLNDHNIPADTKKMIRDMLKKAKANGNNKSEFSFSTKGGSIQEVLNNPKTPDSMKSMLKKMQKKMDAMK